MTEVVVTGIRTEQCYETTARLTSDLGYQVKFILDATATMPLVRWDGAGTLTVDEVLQRTASALHGRFADVVSCETCWHPGKDEHGPLRGSARVHHLDVATASSVAQRHALGVMSRNVVQGRCDDTL